VAGEAVDGLLEALGRVEFAGSRGGGVRDVGLGEGARGEEEYGEARG